MSVAQLAWTAIVLAAIIAAVRLWLRHQPRPVPQHAAPASMIIHVAEASTPPAGYDSEDTDTWLLRPAATGAYEQLAPAALDAAADTLPPYPVAVVMVTPVPEDEPPIAAEVRASMGARRPLDYSTLPQAGQVTASMAVDQPRDWPTLAAQGVWNPRAMPPRADPSGRHRAAGPDPVQWLAEMEPQPQPDPAEFSLPPWDTSDGDAPPVTAAAARATDLPPAAFAALDGLTPAEFVDQLFAREVPHA